MPDVSLQSSVALLYQTVENLKDDFIDSNEATQQQIREIARGQEKQFTEFRGEIRLILNEINTGKKTNWPLLFGFAALFLTVIGGGWTIIKLQTDNTVKTALSDFGSAHAEVSSKLRTDLDAEKSRGEVSISERRANAAEIAANRTATQELKAQNMVINAKLTEVETQFRASDQARNVQFADQQRTNNILMQLTKSGVQYPTGPYFFPSISTGATPNN